MWFVGPWPPPFIAASHTQNTTLQTDTHTHTLDIAHTLTYTDCMAFIRFSPHSFHVRNQKCSVTVPIHKWRPVRPLKSPVAFLAIKEPPEGSCWVKLKAH